MYRVFKSKNYKRLLESNSILCEGMSGLTDAGPVAFGKIATGDCKVPDLNSTLFVIE